MSLTKKSDLENNEKKSLPQYNLVQYLTFFHQKQVLKYEMLEKKSMKTAYEFFFDWVILLLWLSRFTH